MNVSMAHAAAAMNASMRYQELIADNLASSSIPGFRKQELSFSAIQAGLVAPVEETRSGVSTSALIPRTTSSINFAQGELRVSGQPTDLALEGEGFFEVQMPNGSRAYTRDGEFQISSAGELVTKQGYTVLSDTGPIQLDIAAPGAITVSPTGEISQGTEVKGRLKIVTFNDPQLLQPTSAGLFLATNPNLQVSDAANTRVRQGFVESSNTTPVLEMTEMLTSMRMFEANQRVMQLNDERMSRAIGDLGNPN